MRYKNGLWLPSASGVVFSPIMSSFGGGSIRGFNPPGGGGGALPVITQLSDILSNIDANINGSDVTHNGHGFMLYSGYKGGNGSLYTATMDVSALSTIRFVLMGGGGGGHSSNIRFGSAGAGIEGLLDVTSQTSITLTVGSGGAANSNYSSFSDGGTSSIKFSSTVMASAAGGKQATNGSDQRAGTTTSSAVTVISRAYGGAEGTSSDRSALVQTSPTLSGAYAHGACSGKHGNDLSGDTALGYGGGGGGTYGSTQPSPGGPLGYRGGLGTFNNGSVAQGPSVSAGTSFGRNSAGLQCYTQPQGGGGGGAFGGAGGEVYDIEEGATGLVKIWWAANDGDAGKLSTVGNLYN